MRSEYISRGEWAVLSPLLTLAFSPLRNIYWSSLVIPSVYITLTGYSVTIKHRPEYADLWIHSQLLALNPLLMKNMDG